MSENNPNTPEQEMTELEAELNLPLTDPEANMDDLDSILAELRQEIPDLEETEAEAEPEQPEGDGETPEQIPEETPAQEVPAEPQPKKKNIARKVVYYGLLTLFVGVFIYCAVYIVNYMSDSVQAGAAYDDIQSIVNGYKDNLGSDQRPDATLPSGSGPIDPGSSEPENQILPEYQAIYELNKDVVGWIKVPDTLIDYPVMQTPEHPDYYLYRDFNKQWSAWGCIYAREQCDVFTPCDNVVLYGHHMADKSMFAGLDKYKKKSFWEDHQTFTFDTIYERHTYQVIAVFKTSANPGQGFSYHLFNTAQSEEEFNKFIQTVHSMEFYDTGLTAEYGDMLLTLSTCEYTLDNGRFVVVAKQIS